MRTVVVVLLVLLCAACSPSVPPVSVSELPAGDSTTGERLFNTSIGSLQSCSECHSLDGSRGTGPSLQGYGAVAATRRSGEDAIQYTAESIITPGSYVLTGFSNQMPATYSQLLSRQQLADLIAYLLNQ